MKITLLTATLLVVSVPAMAQTPTDEGSSTGPCADQHVPVTSPDPAENPDGFGQLVGEPGETNSADENDGGDQYTGDPAYGDCDGR